MHGNGDEMGGVITLEKCLLELVYSYSKVVKRLIRILLQLITETPHDDAGMVAVTLDPFGYLCLPMLFEVDFASCVLTGPLVVDFVDHEDTVAVAEAHEVFAIGIVRATDVVDTELLHQLYAFLDGSWVGCCTKGAEGVVVGIALQQHFPAIEFQTE